MAEGKVTSYPRRGEVYLVSFDPTIGVEIQKTRPALVIQNDIGNRYAPLTIVAAITSHRDRPLYPHQVLIEAPEGGLQVNSAILLNRIRSFDKQRLVRRLGVLKAGTLAKVDRALQISLGLVVI
jgi:mRNA interferase MazF